MLDVSISMYSRKLQVEYWRFLLSIYTLLHHSVLMESNPRQKWIFYIQHNNSYSIVIFQTLFVYSRMFIQHCIWNRTFFIQLQSLFDVSRARIEISPGYLGSFSMGLHGFTWLKTQNVGRWQTISFWICNPLDKFTSREMFQSITKHL